MQFNLSTIKIDSATPFILVGVAKEKALIGSQRSHPAEWLLWDPYIGPCEKNVLTILENHVLKVLT